jgi:hypothetical protein
MNRLRDESVADPSLARGIDILRSTPGAPSMPETKRRVWAALELGVAGVRFREVRRLSPFRILALTAVMLCLGGTAGAVIGRRWIGPLLLRLTGAAASAPANNDPTGATPRPQPRHATRRVATQPLPPPTVEEAPLPAPTPARALSRHAAITRTPPIAAPAPVARPADGMARIADGQVLEALVALRRDHDPARATNLLARYLAEHPRGALREEAMVLSIEAADARGDKTGAEALTRQYRASYPAGRFQHFVDGHLGGQPESDPK